MNKQNIGGQSTPQQIKNPGYYRAPDKPVYSFNAPKPVSKTPNMDALKASGGLVNRQQSDEARHLDAVRKFNSFGGRGWGGK